MNPFDLTGPAFLLFYLGVGLVVCLIVFLIVWGLEAGETPKMRVSDPYLLAYLRGGVHETLQVMLLALIDRGLLRVDDEMVSATNKEGQADIANPLERRIVERFRLPTGAKELFADDVLRERTTAVYGPELEQLGLIPDAAARRRRVVVVMGGLIVMLAIAAYKLSVARARGRSNIEFLLVEAVGFAFVLAAQTQKTRTTRGDRALADLRTLLRDLRGRVAWARDAAPAGQRVLLAAVFGMGVVTDSMFSRVSDLVRRAGRRPDSTSWLSSCGSSSSSCGSSGGSSCGGGCGGGCGGCGS